MTNWKIQKVSILKLENFFQDYPLLSKTVLPISPTRVKSYLNNPRAKATDIVLYFIQQEEKIIAFRTVWADEIHLDGKNIHFGWCSGNWVDPDFRRKGLSTLMLNEMYADWEGKLMFTNYAPESLAGYLKTGLFTLQRKRTGLRFYLNTSLPELYADRMNSAVKRIALALANIVFRFAYHLKSIVFKSHNLDQHEETEQAQLPDDFSFIDQTSLFQRGEKEFSWIFEYPWLEQDKGTSINYPFSWKVKAFQYRFVTLKHQQTVCSFVISNKNGTVKLLYWNASNEFEVLLAKWLVNFSHRHKVKTLTVFDNQIAEKIRRIKNPFVWSKPMSMDIYSTFDIGNSRQKTFDGDGDYIFT